MKKMDRWATKSWTEASAMDEMRTSREPQTLEEAFTSRQPQSTEETFTSGVSSTEETFTSGVPQTEETFTSWGPLTLEEMRTSRKPQTLEEAFANLKAVIGGAVETAEALKGEITDLCRAAEKNGGTLPDANRIAEEVLAARREISGKSYVVSDLHGCYDSYRRLLDELKLGENDRLYVLGDVIDRGRDGFQILLHMASQPNIIPILGNHEAMAIDALPYLMEDIQPLGKPVQALKGRRAADLWFNNGGEVSLQDFLRMDERLRQIVWEYLLSMPLYREVTAGGKQFVLVHGGLERFSVSRPLADYRPHEILWYRPEADTVYYPDQYVVFGHTPTQLLCSDYGFAGTPGEIVQSGKLIGIDCGCVLPGGQLGCLCMDTMERRYV